MIGVIGPEQLRVAVSWPAAVDAVRQALVDLGSGRVIQPPVVEVRMPVAGELHVKGGHIHGTDWIVVKVATGGFPAGPPTGCLLLVDAASGAPTWLLDDRGWLTQQRTAAAGALATLTFARPDAYRVLILGTGGLSRALVRAIRRSHRSRPSPCGAGTQAGPLPSPPNWASRWSLTCARQCRRRTSS